MSKHKHTYGGSKKTNQQMPAAPSTDNKADASEESKRPSDNLSREAKRYWGLTKAEWVISILTTCGIVVAVLTGVIFWLQLDEMRTDQRGWIGLHIDEPIHLAVNQPLDATLHVKNIGKTPARRVEILSDIEEVKAEDAPDFGNPVKHSHTFRRAQLGDLYPNDSVDFHAARDREIMIPAILTDTENSDLTNGKAYLAVYGHVWYKDIFKKQHDRVFCYWFPFKHDVSYTTGTCTDHNTEDVQHARTAALRRSLGL